MPGLRSQGDCAFAGSPVSDRKASPPRHVQKLSLEVQILRCLSQDFRFGVPGMGKCTPSGLRLRGFCSRFAPVGMLHRQSIYAATGPTLYLVRLQEPR